jgi:cysteine-rich repeat protein
MKAFRFLGSVLFALGLIGAQACNVGADSATSEQRLCTPGAFVFCRCADQAPGTKLCQDDGKAFAACATDESGLCAGGEVEDPDTGKPVDGDGNVVPEVTPTTNDLDACPGKPTAIAPGTDVVVAGDTTGAKDDLKGKAGACITGSGGPDHVYRIQPTCSGQLQVKVQGTGALNPTVYLRSSCADEESQIACAETTGVAGAESLQANVVTGKEYFLVVDGASGSVGKYTITMKLTTSSFCGDGKVDTNEACDDGNKIEGDGCSNSCQRVDGDPTTASGCPGQAVSVWPGRTVQGKGSTNNGLANTFTRTGSSCIVSATNNLNAAPDHIYEVTARGAGTLKVTLTPEPGVNLMLVARSSCADPATQGANMCANNGEAGAAETLSLPVTAGQKVAVAVDGAGTVGNKGTYDISFQLQ